MSQGRHDHDVAQRAAYLEDVLLVDRCLSGEAAAARELFRQRHRRVHATLYRVLGRNRDIDDLVQDTFIEVFKSLQGFRGEALLSTWIDRITVRVAYRYLSKNKTATLTTELAAEPRDVIGTDQRAFAREGVRRLYAALAEMSATARVAFALHEIDGRSVAEVAAVVGASVTATKLRIWRARRALMRRAIEDPVLSEFLSDAHRGLAESS